MWILLPCIFFRLFFSTHPWCTILRDGMGSVSDMIRMAFRVRLSLFSNLTVLGGTPREELAQGAVVK